jgi:PilZ domain
MPIHHRRAFRHAVTLPCQVVRERDFRLVADVAVDLSTDGMLVPTGLRVLTGEPLLVSFRAPRSQRWLDASAVVTRVVHGRRPGDGGRALGISFQGLDHEARQLLFRQLRDVPPATLGNARGRHDRRTNA